MFNKFNFKNIFQNRFSKRHSRSYDKRLIHPVREWLVGLGAFALIIASGSAWSVQYFLKYQNVTTDGGAFQGSVVTLNEPQSRKAEQIFSQKASTYEQLRTSAPVVPAVTASDTNQATTTPVTNNLTPTTTDAVSTSSPVLSH